jgi:hypothetical protein
MKYELETIPVWEALRRESECFLCDLMRDSEHDAISYCLGDSVMNPETRVRVNRIGFCVRHWEALAAAGNPHPLALIGHTYVGETLHALQSSFGTLHAAKPGRKTAQAAEGLSQVLRERERGCLVCEQMGQRLDRYVFTTIRLWTDDAEFRAALKSGKGVCLHHLEALLKMSTSVLDTHAAGMFAKELSSLTEENLRRLEHQVWWMTQKYKAEHASSPWNGCEDAQKRLVRKLIGEGRIWETP